MHIKPLTFLAAGLWLTASCTKPEPEPVPEIESSVGAETPAPPALAMPWDEMDHEQKETYMAEVVTPTMKALFAKFDPEEAEGFGCKTCHGDNAKEVHFEMPNTLHPLDPANFPSPDAEDPEEAEWATFMFETVTPKMVELLGKEPYDHETHEGFGCFGCHAKVGD